MNDTSPLQEVVEEARAWSKETVGMMRSLTHDDTGALDRSLRAIVRKDRFGELTAIRFKIARHGIYQELGAGRGYGGNKGSRWKYEAGPGVSKSRLFYKGQRVSEMRTTDPSAKGKLGTGKRQANPFFDITLETQIPKLADILASAGADVVIKAIGISEKQIT